MKYPLTPIDRVPKMYPLHSCDLHNSRVSIPQSLGIMWDKLQELIDTVNYALSVLDTNIAANDLAAINAKASGRAAVNLAREAVRNLETIGSAGGVANCECDGVIVDAKEYPSFDNIVN